jgi:Iron-sulphur cluster assembly
MPQEIMWNDAEEIGIQLQEKYSGIDPLTVRLPKTSIRRRPRFGIRGRRLWMMAPCARRPPSSALGACSAL